MAGSMSRVKDIFWPESGDPLKAKLQGPKGAPPWILGVLFCLISTFCFICFLISFNLSRVTLLVCVALVLFYGALGSRTGAWERGYPSVNLLVPIGIGTAILAMYIGIKVNVNIYTPYYLAVAGRNYDNVSPTAKTAEYADAGIIRFTVDSALDTSRSFGYKAQDFTYCVAPVVSRTVPVHPDSSGPAISFWAVGKDCCGNRANFACDGANQAEVRNGFSVKDPEKDALTELLVPANGDRPLYLKAIAAAKVLHGLDSADDSNVILVRWAADPDAILQVWHHRAIFAVAGSSIIYSALIIIIWTSIHVYFDREATRGTSREGSFAKPGRLSFGNSPFNRV